MYYFLILFKEKKQKITWKTNRWAQHCIHNIIFNGVALNGLQALGPMCVNRYQQVNNAFPVNTFNHCDVTHQSWQQASLFLKTFKLKMLSSYFNIEKLYINFTGDNKSNDWNYPFDTWILEHWGHCYNKVWQGENLLFKLNSNVFLFFLLWTDTWNY